MNEHILALINEAKEELISAKEHYRQNEFDSVTSKLYSSVEKILIALTIYETKKIPKVTTTLIELGDELEDFPSKFNNYLKELTNDDFNTEYSSYQYSPHDSYKNEIKQLIRKSEEIIEWAEEEIMDD